MIVIEKESYRKLARSFLGVAVPPWGAKKENIGCLEVELLLFGVDFGGERLVGLAGCSLDPALGIVEPG